MFPTARNVRSPPQMQVQTVQALTVNAARRNSTLLNPRSYVTEELSKQAPVLIGSTKFEALHDVKNILVTGGAGFMYVNSVAVISKVTGRAKPCLWPLADTDTHLVLAGLCAIWCSHTVTTMSSLSISSTTAQP
jgi:hypothetical protein